MKRITIKRSEMTTYCVTVDLPEAEANKLLQDPSANTDRLSDICRATNDNWMDAEDAEYEVEEGE